MSFAKIFVTSDTHFGHTGIISFEKDYRPYSTIQDHDRDLIERWNAVVRPVDTVWHLGDVFFGRGNHYLLAQLNGIKNLVMGNHDVYPIELYKLYFNKIAGVRSLAGHVLSHIPVHSYQLDCGRYVGNIHGHMHSKYLEDKRYKCVSVERTGLAPVLLQTVVQNWK